MRDLYTLGTDDANTAIADVGRSRLCDLLRRQERNEARRSYADRLGHSKAQLRAFDNKLGADWRAYSNTWAARTDITERQRTQLVNQLKPSADRRPDAPDISAAARALKALKAVF